MAVYSELVWQKAEDSCWRGILSISRSCVSDQMAVIWSVDWAGDRCHLPLCDGTVDPVWEAGCGWADDFGGRVCGNKSVLAREHLRNLCGMQSFCVSGWVWVSCFLLVLSEEPLSTCCSISTNISHFILCFFHLYCLFRPICWAVACM